MLPDCPILALAPMGDGWGTGGRHSSVPSSSCVDGRAGGKCACSCALPPRAGFFGTIVEYGAERKISRHSVLGAAVSIGVPQGVSLKVK